MTASNPNGVIAGIGVNGLPLTITNPGEIFWVNSSSVYAKDGRPGRTNVGSAGLITGRGTYKRPFATINQALDKCLANRGDIVLVMPGYTETVSSAGGGLAFDVAGTAVVGLGSGSLKPTITLDTIISADVDLSADDVILYNLRFVAGYASVTHCLDVTGADARIDSCDFVVTTASFGFDISIKSSNTAWGLQITNCMIQMECTVALGTAVSDTPVSGISFDGDNTVIKDNVFHGEFSTAMIVNTTTVAEAVIITDNVGANVGTTVTNGAIALAQTCTGIIYRNNFGVLDSTTIDDLILNKNCGMIENYCVNTEAKSGGILGTASG